MGPAKHFKREVPEKFSSDNFDVVWWKTGGTNHNTIEVKAENALKSCLGRLATRPTTDCSWVLR